MTGDQGPALWLTAFLSTKFHFFRPAFFVFGCAIIIMALPEKNSHYSHFSSKEKAPVQFHSVANTPLLFLISSSILLTLSHTVYAESARERLFFSPAPLDGFIYNHFKDRLEGGKEESLLLRVYLTSCTLVFYIHIFISLFQCFSRPVEIDADHMDWK